MEDQGLIGKIVGVYKTTWSQSGWVGQNSDKPYTWGVVRSVSPTTNGGLVLIIEHTDGKSIGLLEPVLLFGLGYGDHVVKVIK